MNSVFKIELPTNLFSKYEISILKEHGETLNLGGKIKTEKLEVDYSKMDYREISLIETKNRINQLNEIKIYKTWKKYQIRLKNWGGFYAILSKANDNEIETLSKTLKLKTTSKDQIIPELIKNSKNLLEVLDDNISYESILIKIKKKLKIVNSINTNKEIEKAIAIKVLEETLSKMSEEQKKKFEKEIIDIAKKEKGITYKAGSVFALLTAAQVSGFGVYLLASTTLSTLSGIIGVTLPFAAYSSLSSAIAVIIGPVGWIGAGLFTLWKINDVNYNKIIPAVIYISWLREKYLS
jgi:uncharacterized protein YaaW (UPF0174 family)